MPGRLTKDRGEEAEHGEGQRAVGVNAGAEAEEEGSPIGDEDHGEHHTHEQHLVGRTLWLDRPSGSREKKGAEGVHSSVRHAWKGKGSWGTMKEIDVAQDGSLLLLS